MKRRQHDIQITNLQIEKGTKVDWISTCLGDLKSLNISESLEKIKKLPVNKYRNTVKQNIEELALNYVQRKK